MCISFANKSYPIVRARSDKIAYGDSKRDLSELAYARFINSGGQTGLIAENSDQRADIAPPQIPLCRK